jgi:uncharacterized protein (DUF433 family)
MEQMPPSSPLSPYVSADPDRMGGEPVFRGTRVPVRSLFDHLDAVYTLDTFLDYFEGVTREQARAVLALAADGMRRGLVRAA